MTGGHEHHGKRKGGQTGYWENVRTFGRTRTNHRNLFHVIQKYSVCAGLVFISEITDSSSHYMVNDTLKTGRLKRPSYEVEK